MLFNKVHEKRIARLTKRLMRTKSYDQARITQDCGSPGCIIGHSEVEFRRIILDAGIIREFLFGTYPYSEPAVNIWSRDAFSVVGCGFAGNNGKKAARYLRKMAKDLKAALKKAS
jgi:hypothetical protein